jgi:hypothetical protein
MALQHLPRPWLLAALAEVPMTSWAQEGDEAGNGSRRNDVLPRPQARRRRLSVRRSAGQWCGEDFWPGAEQWQELEGRAN